MNNMEPNTVFSRFQNLQEIDSSAEKHALLNAEEQEKMKPFFDNIQERMPVFSDFTELQKEALQTPAFWEDDKNVILQGATSAGKTLAAECSMAHQIHVKEKNVIYLVPLKALTTEKENDFLRDFKGKRIYSSSADYQDHDYDLIHGKYDIGILVYEKFFALIAQNQHSFLKNCGLIVVDEMHMLSDPERGPKLEFSIEKVRFQNYAPPAILGLTTTESGMSAVQKWLGGEERTTIIHNTHRPVEIEERFLYCDQYSINTPLYQCWKDGTEAGTKIQIENAESFTWHEDITATDNRFFQLLQVLKNHPDDNEKIIIFCNGKARGEKLMNDICDSGLLPERSDIAFPDFPTREDSEMEDLHYERLQKALFRYGIVYHNASHGISMRTFIEDTFRQKDSGLRIIIATETLTMGVNMPTDIMVLYDTTVYRAGHDGELSPKRLDYQEYKNAVGRAGRYGITRGNRGISYVLTESSEDLKKCIREFVDAPSSKEIISGLQLSKEDIQKKGKEAAFALASASYYMTVLNSEKKIFSDEMLVDLIANGLKRSATGLDDNEKIAEAVIQILCGEYKYASNPPRFAAESDTSVDEFDESVGYTVLPLGQSVSPFALGIVTYYHIQKRFLEQNVESLSKIQKLHHMPVYVKDDAYTIIPDSDEDERPEKIPNYFFDVMYDICRMPEIQNKHQSVAVKNDRKIISTITLAVLNFFEKHNSEMLCWENSTLRKYQNGTEDIPDITLEILYRVIVLYYWTLGYEVTEIRKKLGLPDNPNYYIYTSELQNLVEMCAHQLEAVSRAFEYSAKYPNHDKLKNMFYALSIRVKYGMNGDLARIASKHIHGLTRSKLLRMERAAKSLGYDSAIEFLFHTDSNGTRKFLTKEQDKKLRELLREPLKYEQDQLLDTLKREDMIKDAFIRKFDDYANSLEVFEELLEWMGLDTKVLSNKLVSLKKENLQLYLCLDSKEMADSADVQRTIGYEEPKSGNALIIYKKGILADENEDTLCLLKSDLDMMILRSIYKAGNYKKAGYYLTGLLYCYTQIGRKLCRSNHMEEMLEYLFQQHGNDSPNLPTFYQTALSAKNVISPAALPAVNNYYYNYGTQQFANSIQNTQFNIIQYFSQYEEDLRRQSQKWDKELKSLKINANADLSAEEQEEFEEEFFANASEVISLPAEIKEETIEEAAKEILGEELYAEVASASDNVPDLKNILCQAVYVEQAIMQLKLLQDYSPASTLYGKAIEHCLKKRIFKILKKDCPNHLLNENKSAKKNDGESPGRKLKKLREQDFTMGVAEWTLKKEHCAVPKPDTLLRTLDANEVAYWKFLMDLLSAAKKVRNPSSHSGQETPREDIEKMREYTIEIIKKIHNLPPTIPNIN